MDEPRSPRSPLRAYFVLSWALVTAHTATFLVRQPPNDWLLGAYALLLVPTYAFLYLLPALLLTLAVRLLTRGAPFPVRTAAVLSVALVHLFLFVDRRIFELYGYHVNGFVVNLVLTPGGIDSLGADVSTKLSFALLGLGFVLLQATAALLTLAPRRAQRLARRLPARRLVGLFALFLLGTAGERVAWGLADLESRTDVLALARRVPFHARLSLRSFAKDVGLPVRRRRHRAVDLAVARLRYPLRPLDVDPPKRPPNIVWLVSESLRADMLDPEIMPATWRFAKRAHRFTNHLSGGRGTRMGMFSMFYGLWGNYWWSFLEARRGPVLFEVLERLGYQTDARTSARFTYPEFDKTIFVSFPKDRLHEERKGATWQRDRRNVAGLLRFLEERDPDRPFFAFMFFESPHSRYEFPPESVIRKPYLEEFNYATMDPERDMPLVFARYVNAVHHLDSQLGRVFDALERLGLLDDTIVVVTGDHGEEFMEAGHWGHNSAYSEEQIRVPLVLHVPGTGAGVEEKMTSHVDLVPTILARLGVKNDPADYSLGIDLLGRGERAYAMVADWSAICYVDAGHKEETPYLARGFLDETPPVLDRSDHPVDDPAFRARGRERLLRLMEEMGRFLAR